MERRQPESAFRVTTFLPHMTYDDPAILPMWGPKRPEATEALDIWPEQYQQSGSLNQRKSPGLRVTKGEFMTHSENWL